MKSLLSKIENHLCPTCNSRSSVFHIDKSVNQLTSFKQKKIWDKNKYKNEKKHSKKPLNN